jgi:SUMO ligase MMS21 Smc5/6 complex component
MILHQCGVVKLSAYLFNAQASKGKASSVFKTQRGRAEEDKVVLDIDIRR